MPYILTGLFSRVYVPARAVQSGGDKGAIQANVRDGKASFPLSMFLRMGDGDCGSTGEVLISVVPPLVRAGAHFSSSTAAAETLQPASQESFTGQRVPSLWVCSALFFECCLHSS